MEELARQHPDIIINISASPFSHSKTESKAEIFKSKAKKFNIPVIQVNQTGANTELIFDGASMIINSRGEMWRRLPFFEEAFVTFSSDEIIAGKAPEGDIKRESVELIHKALVTGIRDYFSKSGTERIHSRIVGWNRFRTMPHSGGRSARKQECTGLADAFEILFGTFSKGCR